jgi:methylase of polypeptide subunit release factors
MDTVHADWRLIGSDTSPRAVRMIRLNKQRKYLYFLSSNLQWVLNKAKDKIKIIHSF